MLFGLTEKQLECSQAHVQVGETKHMGLEFHKPPQRQTVPIREGFRA